jgi:flavin reductase (DIM6/NTAB) family NADH-FMN oxidoreductase RutF
VIQRGLAALPIRDAYRILSSLVVPRPIAWVLTQGANGTLNLAPFSSFMGIFYPPALAINFGRKREGAVKDTHRNLRQQKEAVVHIPDRPLLEAMHASADEVDPKLSEVELLGLPTVPSLRVAPPRLADAAVALECRFREEHSLGPGSDLVILDVLHATVRGDLWDGATDCADANRWEPVARLGSLAGPNYATLGERLHFDRPKLGRG